MNEEYIEDTIRIGKSSGDIQFLGADARIAAGKQYPGIYTLFAKFWKYMGGTPTQPECDTVKETTVLVKIQKKTLDALFWGYEKRKMTDPNFKYGIPNDDTIIEFRTSRLDIKRNDNVIKEIPYKDAFGCFDDETNILVIQ